MDTEVMERTPPLNTVVISDLSTEGLVMAYIFIPNYLREPEGGIVAAARAELVKRGVITDSDSFSSAKTTHGHRASQPREQSNAEVEQSGIGPRQYLACYRMKRQQPHDKG